VQRVGVGAGILVVRVVFAQQGSGKQTSYALLKFSEQVSFNFEYLDQ